MRRVIFTLLFVAAAAASGAIHGAGPASADEGATIPVLPAHGLPTDGLAVDLDVEADLQAGVELEGNGHEHRHGFTGHVTADLAVDLRGLAGDGGRGCPLPEDTAGRGLELPELPAPPELPEAPELPEEPPLPEPPTLPDGGDGLGDVTDQLAPVCDCLAEVVDGTGGEGLDGLDAVAGSLPDPGDLPTVLESPESALVGPMVAMSQLPSPVGDVPLTLLQLQQQLAG